MKNIILFFLLLSMQIPIHAQQPELQPIDSVKYLRVARQYHYGIMRDVDLNKALAIYRRLAKEGNSEAMNELGKMYLNGDGIKKNYDIAFSLFSKAAKANYLKAICNLAFMYQKGIGQKIDFRKALQLYRKAAISGSAQGYYGAGYLLYKGLGVEQSYSEAIKYLEKGAQMKHAGCCFLLGSYYAHGYGGRQELDKAKKYFHLASQNGHAWTVDVTKMGLIDSIDSRSKKIKKMGQKKISVPAFSANAINAIDIRNLVGNWGGVAYTYDWSNTKLVNSEPINCMFEQQGDSIAMYYYQGDSLITIYTPYKSGSCYRENKLKEYQKEFKWVITKSQFEKIDNTLYIKCRSLNLKNKDYRRPLILALQKINTLDDNHQVTEINYVGFENNSVTFDVNARRNIQIHASIYSISGEKVIQLSPNQLSEGVNRLRYNDIHLKPGVYIIELLMGKMSKSHKFIVK